MDISNTIQLMSDECFYSKLVEFFQGAVEDVAVYEALNAINASTVCVLPEFPFALVL